MAFHEVRFPTGISFGSRGGPKRKTIVVEAGSGHEHRNSQWADSRREYNAGYGIKTMSDIHAIVSFFEERRGMLHAFRWKDRFDFRSRDPESPPTARDQPIGVGTGAQTTFQLVKTYGSLNPYTRDIKKPVLGTVLIALNGVVQTSGWTVDVTTGIVTFTVAPGSGVAVTAGFEFDVPARFNTDYLEIDLSAFDAGQIPSIPIVEVRL